MDLDYKDGATVLRCSLVDNKIDTMVDWVNDENWIIHNSQDGCASRIK